MPIAFLPDIPAEINLDDYYTKDEVDEIIDSLPEHETSYVNISSFITAVAANFTLTGAITATYFRSRGFIMAYGQTKVAMAADTPLQLLTITDTRYTGVRYMRDKMTVTSAARATTVIDQSYVSGAQIGIISSAALAANSYISFVFSWDCRG
jgi:hypothetical protein